MVSMSDCDELMTCLIIPFLEHFGTMFEVFKSSEPRQNGASRSYCGDGV
jgi:hypothetical protein